jgi:ribosomal protein S18 acetylase RimI-like enzyme
MGRDWTVRRAAISDVPAIMSVAAAAWRDTYHGLLNSGTIESFIERAYSRERLGSRVTEDHFYVAEGAEGIVAFADALERDDRLELLAIYTLPKVRGYGAGTALLSKLVEFFPGRDISADVVENNRKGQVFYERRGFEPRERLEATLFGEAVVERRWWRPAEDAATSRGQRGPASGAG